MSPTSSSPATRRTRPRGWARCRPRRRPTRWRIANDSPFGLGASVFGTDPERNRRVARQLEAGMVSVNSAGGSQAGLPFGGVKRSGIGREPGSVGLEEFMNKKSIRW